MKKVLSIALALVMMMAICVPAFAADLTQKPSDANDVLISTDTKDKDGNDAEQYIVTIPADTVIPWGEAETDVSYSVEAHLTRNNRVNVTVAGNGAMKTADGAYSLAYTLENATFTADSAVYDDTAKVTVKVALNDWKSVAIDSYTDTLTFTAEIA